MKIVLTERLNILRLFLALLFIIFMIFLGCGGGVSGGSSADGSGGGGGSTVSGVAATGVAMSGFVSLKDSIDNDVDLGPIPINPDGSFSFDVTGLTSPFYLEACDFQGNCLYSISFDSGIANINPITNLALAAAAGVNDPADVYNNTSPVDPTDLDNAINYIRNILLPVLESFDVDINPFDPFTKPYTADHTGLDAVFDVIKIEIDTLKGEVTFKDSSGNTLIQASATNLGGINEIITLIISGQGINNSDHILQVNVDAESLIQGFINFYDPWNMFEFSATTVSDISGNGDQVVISGTGTVTIGSSSYSGSNFEVTIVDGTVDEMGIEISYTGGVYPSSVQTVINGGFEIKIE
jgi:hypothetical protein